MFKEHSTEKLIEYIQSLPAKEQKAIAKSLSESSQKKTKKSAKRKLEILTGIGEGLREIKESKRSGKKMKTLDAFLNEIWVSVRLAKNFQREFKRLLKKYPSLKKELTELNETLLDNPRAGLPLGSELFKIRLAIKSKGKGKSGGARVITYVETELVGVIETREGENTIVNLLTIYDKSEVSTITKEDIISLIRNMEFK